MSRPLVISGGRLIDPQNNVDGIRTVVMEDGKVAEVTERPVSIKGAIAVDATGHWVFPGFVDLHVHLREPGEERKETILTGCQAAVAGGFTSVVAMPNTKPVNDCALVTEFVRRRAEEANLCRVYPAGSISKGLAGEELSEMADLVAAGCVCVTDDGRPIQSAALMRRALQYAQLFQLPVMVHEEDLTLSSGGCMHEGATAFKLGLAGVPPSAEVAMVARDLVLMEETGGRLHLAHISCEGSVRLLREAKRRGLAVTAEATPHHFSLTDASVEGYDTHAKMNPPLRRAEDVRAVREALADGTIDAIATDHAPHGVLDKEIEFERAMNGVVGLETAFGLTLELVQRGILSLTRAAQLLTCGPAQAFRLPGGHLGRGAPGDAVVVDPKAVWTVDARRFFSKSRNTPFQDKQLEGRVTHTVVGGRLVFEKGRILEASS